MTMISLDQLRKYKAAGQKKADKDVEGGASPENRAVDEEPVLFITKEEIDEVKVVGLVSALLGFTMTFLVLFVMGAHARVNPSDANRIDVLSYNGITYGLVFDGDKIVETIKKGSLEELEAVARSGVEIDIGSDDLLVGALKIKRAAIEKEIAAENREERALVGGVLVMGVILAVALFNLCRIEQGFARLVTIAKIDGEIGITRDRRRFRTVIPGSPADIQGGLKAGDEIIAINGVRVVTRNDDTIEKLLMIRNDYVKLAIKSVK